MTGVDKARKAGFTGKGIKIAILDSGVDYMHPSLGGCFGENCLVRYGYDLVGDNYGGKDVCDGHGTHVAGIIAATDTVKGFQGVAPNVTLGAWRIFGCRGDTDDDIILAAADMAVNAGMDVINLSLGGGVSAWGEEALAVALSNLAEKGVIVVVAQGNEGRDGIARTPSPAIGEHVIAVGSVDNISKPGHVLRLYRKGKELGSYEYYLTDGVQFSLNGTETEFTTLVPRHKHKKNHTMGNSGTGCEPIMQDIVNKIVLVKRGGCDFGQKAMQVQNAGGAGILIYNSKKEDDPVTIDLHRYSRVTIPVASLSAQDGLSLLRLYYGANDTTQMTMKFLSEILPTRNAGLMSLFSTWGPDPELHLKPDIVGVGGYMYSTFPVALGGYSTMSGTSMATPYISGCIALMMEATGKKSPETIISQLLNYAKPIPSIVDSTFMESLAKQGAGLVQVYDSILASTSVYPYKLPLNDTAHFRESTELTIENLSNFTKIYHLEHVPSVGIAGYDFKKSAVPLPRGKYKIAESKVRFESESIILKAHETRNITVHFEQPPPLQKSNDGNPVSPIVYGGFIHLRPVAGDDHPIQDSKSIHIPYFGVLGNQSDLPLFDRKSGYPYIGNAPPTYKSSAKLPVIPAVIPAYNFSKNDKLHLYVRLGSPTALLKCELIKDDKVVGYVSRFHNAWVPRNDNSRDNYDYSINWNGHVAMDFRHSLSSSSPPTNSRGPLLPSIKTYPANPGVYHLKLSALKVFGNADLPEDWETWSSHEFTILG
ncbi:peptidase S8/S53 domain-containing protein [Halteromyces radiatus]|uniref:peptidase S8/S53 domain-containing protein n=1 Tax=Halteromyces radiatus TaxID=101107 RepID=UPI00221F6936|nr:peptidase S8/S53 domain-containing protein [Halteromyces radiatus]KAI8089167.1 peptidase S8/S53 domain-containing protein [Halteromyces radiatus]